jgi:hypothetical protein
MNVHSAPVDAAAVAGDAQWLAHRYDEQQDAVHFVRLERDAHRSATFITEEYFGEDRPLIVLARADAMAAAAAPAPIHFIFHSAFCCSTLLARAMDIPGIAIGLKEPRVLNDMAGWKGRGAPPARLAPVLDDTMKLLARPFAPGESVVVKPSNVINSLAAGMLHLRPEANALLLYAPLETFVRSVAKKGMWCRLWARDLLVLLLDEGLIDLGFSPKDYLKLTDLQAAATAWLAQQALFQAMADRFGPERVRTLDSASLVARPAEVMTLVSDLFRLGLNPEAVEAIVAGPAFNRHSKWGTDFSAEQREAEHRDAAAVHADEIGKVTAWAGAVAANAGVPLHLRAPLLG